MLQALLAAALMCPVPLEPTRTAYVTTVYVGSKGPLRFLVDTGATITVVDRSVGLEPSRTITAISTTGSIDVQEATVDEMRAGNVTVTQTPVLIADLPRFPNHGHLDGLLGMSFFAGRAMLIDAGRRCLEVDAEAPSGTTLAAHEVVGRVAVEIEGFNFILDSGASFPVLTSARSQALAVDRSTGKITTAAGKKSVATATIPLFRIGAMTFRDVAVAIAPGRDAREDGLLPITPFAAVYIAADRKSIVVK